MTGRSIEMFRLLLNWRNLVIESGRKLIFWRITIPLLEVRRVDFLFVSKYFLGLIISLNFQLRGFHVKSKFTHTIFTNLRCLARSFETCLINTKDWTPFNNSIWTSTLTRYITSWIIEPFRILIFTVLTKVLIYYMIFLPQYNRNITFFSTSSCFWLFQQFFHFF